jgi:catechol 2,3-dioxygenase-like lactoylglutathione lyase family enzyme
MAIKAKYAHTNMIVNDLKKMVAFYKDVLGFTEAEPLRTQAAPSLEKLTGIPGASIQVQHLRYPGDSGDQGPTLEIIRYEQQLPHEAPAANRPGFRHMCFTVEDVEAAFAAVVAAGGGTLGEVVHSENARTRNHVVYATDPEGNILELLRRTPR